MKFRVGDRVEYVKATHPKFVPNGLKGTIRGIWYSEILVEFDEKIKHGHDGNRVYDAGGGRYKSVTSKDIRLIDTPEPKIEFMKMRCTCEYEPGVWFTKGRTYKAQRATSGRDKYEMRIDEGDIISFNCLDDMLNEKPFSYYLSIIETINGGRK